MDDASPKIRTPPPYAITMTRDGYEMRERYYRVLEEQQRRCAESVLDLIGAAGPPPSGHYWGVDCDVRPAKDFLGYELILKLVAKPLDELEAPV